MEKYMDARIYEFKIDIISTRENYIFSKEFEKEFLHTSSIQNVIQVNMLFFSFVIFSSNFWRRVEKSSGDVVIGRAHFLEERGAGIEICLRVRAPSIRFDCTA